MSKEDVNDEKSLGLLGSLAMLVGCIIGSGIFMSVSETLLVTPNSVGLVIVYWGAAGLIAIVGGLSYAELGCAIPQSGGERTYFAKTFGSPLAVTFTYIYTFLIKGTTIAGVALTAGLYLVQTFLPGCKDVDFIAKIVSAAAILIALMLSCTSKKIASNIQIIFTVLKLFALVCIIVAGVVTMIRGKAKDMSTPFKYHSVHWNKLGNAFVNIFWATEGWNVLGSVVGNMKNPKRDLPIVMIFGVLTVLVMYCLTIISYIAVLGYDTVANSPTVAIEFSQVAFGKFAFLVPIFIVCSAFGALNGNVFAIPFVCLSSGYAREIPSIFALVRVNERTPVVAISALCTSGLMFLFFNFQTLLKYCAFCTWVFYFLVMCVIYYLRIHQDIGKPDQFRVPIFFPAIIQVVALYVIYSIVVVEKMYVGCLLMFGLMCLVFFAHLKDPSRFIPTCVKEAHQSIELTLMRNFNLVHCCAYDL